jgi:hypothetical protein
MAGKITIVTTQGFEAALEEIRRATDKKERTDVIRDALELYDIVVTHVRQGKRIFIGDSREGSAEVRLPHLLHAQKYRGLSIVRDDD